MKLTTFQAIKTIMARDETITFDEYKEIREICEKQYCKTIGVN